MKVGAVFPHTEIGIDPSIIRDYCQAVEGLGCSHLVAYDETLLTDPDEVPGIPDFMLDFTLRKTFHEPLVLFGFIAAVTTTLELVTSVLVVTARQTGIVAKQAAEIDVLSGGRLRLGLGLGWNERAYRALGEQFETRGRRIEEQIEVLRALWTQKAVNFRGEWHEIASLGLNPSPLQRPIPIWLGGQANKVVDRVARVADGWMPDAPPDSDMEEKLVTLRDRIRKAGRNPADVGLEGRVSIANKSKEEQSREIEAWRRLGASHVSVDTMAAGLGTITNHIKAIEAFVTLARG